MKKILPIVVLLVLALCLAAWLLRPRGSAGNSVNTIRDDAATAYAGMPLQDKPETGADALPAQLALRDPAAVGVEATPGEGLAAPALHVPDYGPWLSRGGAKVQFELFDALGARVQVGAFTSMRVRRKLGRYFATEDASRDILANVLLTRGLGVTGGEYTGLEPGQYVLEAESSRWGALQHEFSVKRGEERTERITLAHFERVACFRFVHEDGAPVTWLRAVPVIRYAEVRADGAGIQPDRVLRELPGEERQGGAKYWRSSPSGILLNSNSGIVMATDEGRWYVKVVSGREATVKFELDEEVWGVAEYTVTSTFDGPEWTEHTVRLSTPPDYLDRVKSCQQQGLQDPGHRSLLSGPVPLIAPDPLKDPVGETEARLLVQLQCNIPLKVVGTPNRSSTSYDFAPHPSGWFLDVPRGDFVRCRVTDKRWFTSDHWEMDPVNGGIVQESRVIVAPLMRVDLSGLSPTLRAFPAGVGLSLDPRKPRQPGDEFGEAEESNVSRTVTGTFALRGADFIDVPWGGGIFQGSAGWTHAELRADLSGGSRMNRPRSGGSNLDIEGRSNFEPKVLGLSPLKLPMQDGFAAAAAAGVKLECAPMLVLRATGDNGEGLPWVEATLLRFEDDALCQSIRESFAQSYPAIVTTITDHAAALDTEGSARDAALAALIGEEAAALLTTREQREWFARHGAWYNTGSRLWTQEHGYMLHDTVLEPGQIYVLYLWSNSRDDLVPDRRIVFRAAEGVTDLGVIALPSYSE